MNGNEAEEIRQGKGGGSEGEEGLKNEGQKERGNGCNILSITQITQHSKAGIHLRLRICAYCY